MIGREFSFDEYKDFYDEKFAPIEIPDDLRIDQPADIEIIDENTVPEQPTDEDNNTDNNTPVEEEDDFPFGF